MTPSTSAAHATYPRNAWYPAAWSHTVTTGGMHAMVILGEPVLLLRGLNGAVSALADCCPHRGAPLSLGLLQPDSIRCGYHGLSFDFDGRCVDNPHGDGRIPAAMAVRRYPVRERHTVLWVWMGHGPADEAAIPDLSVMDEREDGLQRGRDSMRMDADALLVADNLLDLSHANYLHEGILGWPEHSRADITARQEGQRVITSRVMSNVPVPRMHDLLFRRDGRPVDMWNDITWDAPGCLQLVHGVCAPGQPRESGFAFTAVHLLTPTEPGSTNYLYGIARPPAGADEARVKDEVAATRSHVFKHQDEVMLHGQQRVLQQLPHFKPTLLALDGASVRMRRVIDRMVSDETARLPG